MLFPFLGALGVLGGEIFIFRGASPHPAYPAAATAAILSILSLLPFKSDCD
jgi:hypothetical protein